MQVVELLRRIDIGNSVAEYDKDLGRYFLETEVFDALEDGDIDIVAGDKGTGKTALYTMLATRFSETQHDNQPEVLVAFNPQGSPVFQHLIEHGVRSEEKYISIWKTYFFSLCGNWLLTLQDPKYSEDLSTLDRILRGLNLKSTSFSPESTFKRILSRMENLLNWEAAEFELEIGAEGSFRVKPRLELKDIKPQEPTRQINIDGALRHLNKCLKDARKIVWVALDRLDEAFQGNFEVELPALRALFRSFLDLQEFSQIHLKLFVRRDLFRRITHGGFVNLTHINARKREIIWDEEDLKSLLCKRVRDNVDVMSALDLSSSSDAELFDRLFPDQVDFGKRKPKTWVWMMRRVRDGNDVKPPRNLIDLVRFAVEAQIRSEVRSPREDDGRSPLIEPESLRRALTQLSQNRVTDTLLAEAKDFADYIEMFRRGKAEHNDESISELLGLPQPEVRRIIKGLTEFGFLEPIKGTYKIPSLYRDGLEITQGKAFDPTSDGDDDDE